MRTVLLVFCALLMLNVSLEAKRKVSASQKSHISKQHFKQGKKIVKSRKAPKAKHRQKVN